MLVTTSISKSVSNQSSTLWNSKSIESALLFSASLGSWFWKLFPVYSAIVRILLSRTMACFGLFPFPIPIPSLLVNIFLSLVFCPRFPLVFDTSKSMTCGVKSHGFVKMIPRTISPGAFLPILTTAWPILLALLQDFLLAHLLVAELALCSLIGCVMAQLLCESSLFVTCVCFSALISRVSTIGALNCSFNRFFSSCVHHHFLF